MSRLRKSHIAALALIAAVATVTFGVVSSASGITVKAGNLVLVANGGFAPQTLPRTHNAPIRLFGGGKISTTDGSLPPILETIEIEFDKHGHVETRGLPKCTRNRLENTTVKQARRSCGRAIVGKGSGRAIVKFPDQAPIPVSSPITLFNGPRIKGDHSVIAHAHTTVPAPTTFIVPVRIERIRKGRYGYRTKARIPRIAGGYGVPIAGHLKIHRRWRFKRRKLSFVNARCVGGRLQARGRFEFKDGTRLSASFLRPCRVRR